MLSNIGPLLMEGTAFLANWYQFHRSIDIHRDGLQA